MVDDDIEKIQTLCKLCQHYWPTDREESERLTKKILTEYLIQPRYGELLETCVDCAINGKQNPTIAYILKYQQEVKK